MTYENVIFDFYGTLVDIETDEEDPKLWKEMADLYGVYGAVYQPKDLYQKYHELVEDETERLRLALPSTFEEKELLPEIDLKRVFVRLLREAPKYRPSSYRIHERHTEEELLSSDWVDLMANTFRILSRKRFSTYTNTIQVLETLKENGIRVYLLSNAQGVFTRAEIEAEELTGYFDDIFISSEWRLRKPSRYFMEALLKKHGLSVEKSVMVGNDFRSDMQVAGKVGMDAIYLNTFHFSEERLQKEKEILQLQYGRSPVIYPDGDIGHVLERM